MCMHVLSHVNNIMFLLQDIYSNEETTETDTITEPEGTSGPVVEDGTEPGIGGVGPGLEDRGRKDSKKSETGGIIGATVAAIVVILLIIAVVVVLIVLYISRQKVEKLLARTTSLGTSKCNVSIDVCIIHASLSSSY